MPDGSFFSGLIEQMRPKPEVAPEMQRIFDSMPEMMSGRAAGEMQKATGLLEKRFIEPTNIGAVSKKDADLAKLYGKIVCKGALEVLTPAANIQSLKWLLSFVNRKNELINDEDLGLGIELSVKTAMEKLENTEAEEKLAQAIAVTTPHREMFMMMAQMVPSLDQDYADEEKTAEEQTDKFTIIPLKVMSEWVKDSGASKVGRDSEAVEQLCTVASCSHFMDRKVRIGYMNVLAELVRANPQLSQSESVLDAFDSLIFNIADIEGKGNPEADFVGLKGLSKDIVGKSNSLQFAMGMLNESLPISQS